MTDVTPSGMFAVDYIEVAAGFYSNDAILSVLVIMVAISLGLSVAYALRSMVRC